MIGRAWKLLRPVVEHLLRRTIYVGRTRLYFDMKPYSGMLKRDFADAWYRNYPDPRSFEQIMADADRLPFIFWDGDVKFTRWSVDE